MRNLNSYYEGFNGSDKQIDYLKHGILNEFGYNLSFNSKECYNEDKIIKTECNRKDLKEKNNK